jgi:hypothetical protein
LPKKTFEAAAAAKAHLIVQLKDNQLALCRRAEAVCANAPLLSGVRTIDAKRRNRHETRLVGAFDATPAVAGTEWQPFVAAIIKVERIVLTFQPATGLWKRSQEVALYLSSRPIKAADAARVIRGHWGIENRLHYVRDVTLREDASRIRKNPAVFATIRSFAYNILRFNLAGSFAQTRYAAALGGLKSLASLRLCQEN